MEHRLGHSGLPQVVHFTCDDCKTDNKKDIKTVRMYTAVGNRKTEHSDKT